MLVKALLEEKSREIITTRPTATVDEVMEVLIEKNIGCLPVLDNSGKLIGIVSDKDIFRRIHETKGNYHSLTVQDVMSSEVIVGLPTDDLSYVAGLMDKNWIRHVPIVSDGELVGLVSQRDINHALNANTQIENRYLNLYMDSFHRRDRSGDE